MVTRSGTVLLLIRQVPEKTLITVITHYPHIHFLSVVSEIFTAVFDPVSEEATSLSSTHRPIMFRGAKTTFRRGERGVWW